MKRFFLLTLLSIFLVSCDAGPQVQWEKYTEENFKRALQSGRPTVVYFYAAWCRPCQLLKSKTFSDLRVIEALENFSRLKADLSFRESRQTIAISDHHRISALPTLAFYDASGEEIKERMYGFFTAEVLLEFLEKV